MIGSARKEDSKQGGGKPSTTARASTSIMGDKKASVQDRTGQACTLWTYFSFFLVIFSFFSLKGGYHMVYNLCKCFGSNLPLHCYIHTHFVIHLKLSDMPIQGRRQFGYLGGSWHEMISMEEVWKLAFLFLVLLLPLIVIANSRPPCRA